MKCPAQEMIRCGSANIRGCHGNALLRQRCVGRGRVVSHLPQSADVDGDVIYRSSNLVSRLLICLLGYVQCDRHLPLVTDLKKHTPLFRSVDDECLITCEGYLDEIVEHAIGYAAGVPLTP